MTIDTFQRKRIFLEPGKLYKVKYTIQWLREPPTQGRISKKGDFIFYLGNNKVLLPNGLIAWFSKYSWFGQRPSLYLRKIYKRKNVKKE